MIILLSFFSKVLNNNLNSASFEVIAGQHARQITTLETGAQRIAVVAGKRHQNYNSLYLSESFITEG
jgi:hypothetical protein